MNLVPIDGNRWTSRPPKCDYRLIIDWPKPKDKLRKFDKRSKHFLLGDNFINSKNLISWPCIRGYCESEETWCWSLLGIKWLKQVKRNNLFFASLICSYVWPFLCIKMWESLFQNFFWNSLPKWISLSKLHFPFYPTFTSGSFI